ncbi:MULTISPECIES: RES family NAD+ phosphorylase [unclassified Streptomyces]|uniref:RES family NAD+ phosphorylase n=1 Tax=unclassified Streptomyces TaxID=2593676 RepID=UPI002ED09A52|nr:RES family NAD+ phosphorylase [Streptomyces sp. NBC_00891]WSY04131.1 RES family NAD+ phosphorylase [Streptomyces sp. NBC_00890]WSZ05757.1 RES family NAD+ phosphorylase [Streptomyces sp. NBC_00869]WSZ26747.1 RES family NAD+ phosphorylase [Streptomyces sp. NBC_00870]
MTGLFPMTSLELRPVRHVIPAGTELWRVHNTRWTPHEFNPNLADPFEFTDGNRFDGTPLDPYHCLYLADTATTALAESVLRSRRFEQPAGRRRIPYATVVHRSLSVLRTRCDLTLVSLIEAKDLAAVCQESTLLEDERNYVSARRWASEIRAQAPDVMGLIWQSRHNRPQCALVLFHDRFPDCDGKPLDVVAGSGIAELDSDEGIDRANEYLDPLRAEISRPRRE